MKFHFYASLACISYISEVAYARPAQNAVAANTGSTAYPKALFLNVGDSTTAPNGGWGDSFHNYTLNSQYASSVNQGKSGASTASYLAQSLWNNTLSVVRSNKSTKNVFVTIQFGHNDQKIANFSTQYGINLARMAKDVKAAGGTPILVTPLSRRNYFANNTMDDILKSWRDIVVSVAKQTNTTYIDLWQTSYDYLLAIGPEAAHRLNLNPNDNTHVNPNGGLVFATMVAGLLKDTLGSKWSYVWAINGTIAGQIRDGVPSF